MFETCNLIILSLPKTPETDNIIDAKALKKLNDKYIVNVGRSNSIDQKALYKALKNGEIAGAAIDTWDKKPADKHSTLNPSEQPFTELDNIVLSPHQATRINLGHQRYVSDITEKVIRYITAGELVDQIDYQKGY